LTFLASPFLDVAGRLADDFAERAGAHSHYL
jgi:hypothetical protein